MWRQAVPVLYKNSLPTQCRFIPAAAEAGRKNLRPISVALQTKTQLVKISVRSWGIMSKTEGGTASGLIIRPAGTVPAPGPDHSISQLNRKCKSFLFKLLSHIIYFIFHHLFSSALTALKIPGSRRCPLVIRQIS